MIKEGFELTYTMIESIVRHAIGVTCSQGSNITPDKMAKIIISLGDVIKDMGIILDTRYGKFYQFDNLILDLGLMYSEDDYILSNFDSQYKKVFSKRSDWCDIELVYDNTLKFYTDDFIEVYEKKLGFDCIWNSKTYKFLIQNLRTSTGWNGYIAEILYVTYMACVGCFAIHKILKDINPDFDYTSLENRLMMANTLKYVFDQMLNVDFPVMLYEDDDEDSVHQLYIHNNLLIKPNGYPQIRNCDIDKDVLNALRLRNNESE